MRPTLPVLRGQLLAVDHCLFVQHGPGSELFSKVSLLTKRLPWLGSLVGLLAQLPVAQIVGPSELRQRNDRSRAVSDLGLV